EEVDGRRPARCEILHDLLEPRQKFLRCRVPCGLYTDHDAICGCNTDSRCAADDEAFDRVPDLLDCAALQFLHFEREACLIKQKQGTVNTSLPAQRRMMLMLFRWQAHDLVVFR